MPPVTPRKTGKERDRLILSLNNKFSLDLPVGGAFSPDTPALARECVKRIWVLCSHNDDAALARVEKELEQRAARLRTGWVYKPGQERGTLPVARSQPGEENFLRRRPEDGVGARDEEEKELLLKILQSLLDEEVHLTKKKLALSNPSDGHGCGDVNTGTTPEATTKQPIDTAPTTASAHAAVTGWEQQQLSPSKRRLNAAQEVFQTTPNSRILPRHTTSTASSTSSPLYPSLSVLPRGDNDNDDDDDDDDEEEFGDPAIDFGTLTVTDLFVGVNQASPRKEKQQKIDRYYTSSGKPNSTSKNCSDDDPFRSLQPKDKRQQPTVNDYMRVSKAGTSSSHAFGSMSTSTTKSEAVVSFSTVTTSDASAGFSFNDGTSTVATSFEDEQDDKDSDDSLFQSDQFQQLLNRSEQDLAEDGDEPKIREIVRELEANGPFAKCRMCHSTLPFRYRYEAQRVADANGVPLAEILSHAQLPSENYDEFWGYLQDQCQTQKGQKRLLAKSKRGPWEMAVDHFQDTAADTDEMVTLSGRLSWCDKPGQGLLKFQLNPLLFERGNRLCRRFGSDRFLELTFSALRDNQFPLYRKHSYNPALLAKGFTQWLATSEHHIAGRVWRAFYLEDVKKKKDAPQEAKGQDIKVHFFAVDGDDFDKTSYPQAISPDGQGSDRRSPMSIESLINWHIPLKENLDQSDCKLFQRIHLGLSRTLPTVSVLPEETIFLKDVKPVMNDGCARMSRSLATSITQHLGIGSTPSCFQARIAGAKGVWMVARDDDEANYKAGDRNHWIEISQSQLKIGPHPCYEKVALEPQQLNFEVVTWSRPPRPTQLNKQLLMVLQHGGVRREHLKSLIEQEIFRYYEEFKTIMTCSNSSMCRQWLQSRAHDESYKRKTRRIDGFPATYTEQALLLVESGFFPLKLPYLTDLFEVLLKDHLDLFKDLKIQISWSTYAYCIADPYGILKEDEVHFAFSRSLEEHGYHGSELDDIDVLVARLPAHRPSDVQKRKAVYKKELRHFKDVIVFSTVGDIPLASLLSGGDYDGDQPWICWDPNIVDPFENSPYYEDDHFQAEDVGLVNHSVSMDTYGLLHQGRLGSLNGFLAKVFSVNAVPSKLGLCTVQHENLCYYQNRIDSAGAMKLADLLGHLVDARKAGHGFPPENFRKLQAELGRGAQNKPAYKNSREKEYNPENIVDYLKFQIIENQSDRVLSDFKSLKENKSRHAPDSDLLAEWDKLWKQALVERDNGRTLLVNTLMKIQKTVEGACERWKAVGNSRGLRFHERIDRAAEMLDCIRPPALLTSAQGSEQQSHPWFHTWHNCEESWVTFRASCAYKWLSWEAFPWYAAGPTLCSMKAKSSGDVRILVWSVYAIMKADKRAAKKQWDASLRSSESDDEGDGYVDAEGETLADDADTEVELEIGDEEDDWATFA